MAIEKILVPDVGGAASVEVIELLVKVGDTIQIDDSLITLESDKASMDVPAPIAGMVKDIQMKVGDHVKEGDCILSVETNVAKSAEAMPDIAPTGNTSVTSVQAVVVPDVGGAKDVEVIEILVTVGATVVADEGLVTLESDKASMDVPAPLAGIVKEIKVTVGDKVNEGSVILLLETTDSGNTSVATKPAAVTTPIATVDKQPIMNVAALTPFDNQIATINRSATVYAGPAVRRIAQEFGINLTKVAGSGRKGRITSQDVQAYVKGLMQKIESGAGLGGGLDLLPWPKVDFSKFGTVETKALNKIKRATARNLHRNWVMIPHVTQFDEVDITDLEEFRKKHKEEAEKKGYKLTPLVFIMKAVVAALQQFPQFNASLDESGENLIVKKYYNIGVAVDTPNGLVVPVLRDVDKKAIHELAIELAAISIKARDKGLSMQEMQGGNFTISSLGGIGGTAFTPIVNAPDVAILGVSRSSIKPMYQDNQFQPRLMLPLSLSYDHRVIDGADGARFITYLNQCLTNYASLML